MPVGAYGGRRDIMQQIAPAGPIYQAGTLSGNPVAMAAGLAMLELIQAPGFHDELERTHAPAAATACSAVARRGRRRRSARTASCGMFGLFFTREQVDTLRAGDRLRRRARSTASSTACSSAASTSRRRAFEAGFVSSAHSEQIIADTLEAARGALREAAAG